MKKVNVKIVGGLLTLVLAGTLLSSCGRDNNPLLSHIDAVYSFVDHTNLDDGNYLVCYKEGRGHAVGLLAAGDEKNVDTLCENMAKQLYAKAQSQKMFMSATLNDWQDQALLKALSDKAQKMDDDFSK